jgi:hypothetical protein
MKLPTFPASEGPSATLSVPDPAPVTFDQLTQMCKSCKAELTSFLPKPMTTPEVVEFLKTKIERFCACGATTCDVKLRIRKGGTLSEGEQAGLKTVSSGPLKVLPELPQKPRP